MRTHLPTSNNGDMVIEIIILNVFIDIPNILKLI